MHYQLVNRLQTLVMVESVASIEHAFKVLELIVRHLQNRIADGSEVNDWHHRKKYYMRLCELTAKRGRPEVIFALFGNLTRFQISTYFAKEAVRRLASQSVPAPILLRIAELCKMQRGPADKGVRSAYAEVVDVLRSRGLAGDSDLLAKAEADRKALFLPIRVGQTPPQVPTLGPSQPGENVATAVSQKVEGVPTSSVAV